jgi:hypothetical protein
LGDFFADELGTSSPSCVDDGEPFMEYGLLSSIDSEKAEQSASYLALQQLTRSELLLSDVAFINSGE